MVQGKIEQFGLELFIKTIIYFQPTSQLTPTTLAQPAPAPSKKAPGSSASLATSAMLYSLEWSGNGNI